MISCCSIIKIIIVTLQIQYVNGQLTKPQINSPSQRNHNHFNSPRHQPLFRLPQFEPSQFPTGPLNIRPHRNPSPQQNFRQTVRYGENQKMFGNQDKKFPNKNDNRFRYLRVRSILKLYLTNTARPSVIERKFSIPKLMKNTNVVMKFNQINFPIFNLYC